MHAFDDMLIVSIIILFVDGCLQLFEGGDIDESIFEGNGMVIVVSEKFHNLSLSAAFEGGFVLELETEIAFVQAGASGVFLFWGFALALDGMLSEEIVSVEKPVGPECDAAEPQGSHTSQPPSVGFLDEVSVVKH